MNLSQETDRALSEGRRLVIDNQTGGRHRLNASIGKGSKDAKLKIWLKRAGFMGAALVSIMVAASVAGLILDGIGFWGIMLSLLAAGVALGVFSNFPKVKIPKRSELKQGNPRQMVARTELWLESQRAALPAPAAAIVDQLGVQLDALGAQLQTLDEAHPAMTEVRELVGEYIPETIDNYSKIPEHLRKEDHAGGTADERLVSSLDKLSGEVDRVTRRLAEGALDDLAVKSRYLDYRYGGDELLDEIRPGNATIEAKPDEGSGVPLPDLSPATETTKAPR